MKKLVILGAAAVALVATPVIAQLGQGRQQGATRAQVQAKVGAMFARVDANRDGFVTKAEGQAFRTAVRGDRRADRSERREARFARLDANRDGSISRAEFMTPRRAEDRAERRENRMERRAERRERKMERRANRGLRMGARAFERMDANKDGRVSLAEATALRLQRFDRIDANRDGRITREERRAARASRG